MIWRTRNHLVEKHSFSFLGEEKHDLSCLIICTGYVFDFPLWFKKFEKFSVYLFERQEGSERESTSIC